jgi:predicted permease
MIEALRYDLRLAVRALASRPLFSLSVIATLALGIGANTAVATLLRPYFMRLPAPDPEAVLGVGDSLSYPQYAHVREHSRTLSTVAAAERIELQVSAAGEEPRRVIGELVSDNFFGLLGARAARGRLFSPEEARTADAPPVVVASHAFWQERLGSDAAAVGQEIRLNGRAFTLIGVTEPKFVGLGIGAWAGSPLVGVHRRVDLWVPLHQRRRIHASAGTDGEWFSTGRGGLPGHRFFRLEVLGRRAPGRTDDEVAAEMQVLMRRLLPDSPRNGVHVRPRFLMGHAPPQQGGIWPLVIAAPKVVLLIACANVMGLVLARAVSRRREVAVRMAVGASRWQIVRYLLVESALLAVAGALGGLYLVWVGLRRFVVEPLSFPDLGSGVDAYLVPDWDVLLYTLALTLPAVFLIGLVPALRATRIDIVHTIKNDDDPRATSPLRDVLVVAQVALCLVLLSSAGLLLRGVDFVRAANPGLPRDEVVVLGVDLDKRGDSWSRQRETRDRIEGRLAMVPGVRSVARADRYPLYGAGYLTSVTPEGAATETSSINWVTSAYFETMDLPIVRGRTFTPEEVQSGAPVVIVSEATARRFWAGQDPIGRRMKVQGSPDRPALQEVIGVARDAEYTRPQRIDPVFIYVPMSLREDAGSLTLVRVASANRATLAALRAAVHELDPTIPLTARALADVPPAVEMSLKPLSRFAGLLGGVAMVLAAVGLYAAVAGSLARRTREIGTRMALGADAGRILRLVLGQGMRLTAVGVLLGLAGAAAVSTVLLHRLHNVIPAHDAAAYLGAAGFLVVVAFIATWLPARRAAATQPAEALRSE